MSKTSCIVHPPSKPLVMIRAEYLILCDGNACAAALLNEFEQWENHMLAAVDHEWAMPGEEAPAPDEWFYWTRQDVAHEMLFVFSDHDIDKALKLIIDHGFVNRRMKGRHEMDHSYQYRFDVAKVQAAIDGLGDTDYDASILQHRVARTKQGVAGTKLIKESRDKDKTKTEIKDKDGAPKAARPRDLIYDTISSTWKITGGALIGQIKSVLTGTAKKGAWAAAKFDTPVTDPDEIARFGKWYGRKYPGISLPNSPALIQSHFYAFRTEQVKKIITPESAAAQADYDAWLHSLPAHDPKWSSYPGLVSHRAN